MSDLSELDELSAPEVTLKDMALVDAMREWTQLTAQHKYCAERIKDLNVLIRSHADEEPGEYVITAGDYEALIRVPEKWEWDSDELSHLLTKSLSAAPEALTTKHTMNKKKFEEMPSSDQAGWLPALTIKPGRETIKVTLKEKEEEDED